MSNTLWLYVVRYRFFESRAAFSSAMLQGWDILTHFMLQLINYQ